MSDPSTIAPARPPAPGVAAVTLDPKSERGYARDAASQEAFRNAAESLRQADGWPNPAGSRQLVADQALAHRRPNRGGLT
jgi:hypothetical protein